MRVAQLAAVGLSLAALLLAAAPAQATHDIEEPDHVFVCLAPQGEADCNTVAVGGGNATGDVAVAADGDASGSIALAPTGDADGHNAGVSGTGDANGHLAASGTGTCNDAEADAESPCLDVVVPDGLDGRP